MPIYNARCTCHQAMAHQIETLANIKFSAEKPPRQKGILDTDMWSFKLCSYRHTYLSHNAQVVIDLAGRWSTTVSFLRIIICLNGKFAQ